jgi:hypothetical protein
MPQFPPSITGLFSPDEVVDMSGYVDNCQCQCQQHFTVQDGLLNVHGRPVFDRLLVKGDLLLADNQDLRRLPDILAVTGTLSLSNCLKLEYMPSQLFADRIFLDGTLIRELPIQLVADTVDLSGCPNLKELPADTEVRVMKAAGCTDLKEIPAGIKFASLDLSGTAIVELPADLTISHELRLRSCSKLTTLNEGMTVGTGIDVRGCDMLFTLPRSVQPTLAITDGMMLINDYVVVPKMSSEEAAMCLGVKANVALPHRHFKNLEHMQQPIAAVDQEGRNAGRGRAVATLASGATRRLMDNRFFRGFVGRMDERLELPSDSNLKLL